MNKWILVLIIIGLIVVGVIMSINTPKEYKPRKEKAETSVEQSYTSVGRIQSGLISVTKAAGDSIQTEQDAHGLNRVPAFFAYVERGGSSGSYPLQYQYLDSDGTLLGQVSIWVNDTNVNVSIWCPTGSSLIAGELKADIKYYLLIEEAG